MNIKSIQKNSKQILAVFAAFLLMLVSAFNLYTYKYTEDFKLDYLSDRLTVLLNQDRYIEAYRLHDYTTNFNSTIPVHIAENSSKAEFSIQSDDPRGLNTKVTEKIDGVQAEIYSELTRVDSTNFKLNRQYKFSENTDFTKLDRVYMQIILGGGEFQYNSVNQTVNFQDCKLKLTTLSNIDISYNSSYKVLTLNQRILGQKLLNFNIEFNINCNK